MAREVIVTLPTGSSQSRGFTLVELLIVIAIIVVLIGFLFPAFTGVQIQAKKTQTLNDLTQIVTAANAFYTEYGKYPTAATTDSTATYGPGNSKTNDLLFNELRATGATLNTRQIVFMSPPEAKDQNPPRGGIGTSNGRFYDPWGSEYAVALDADYDTQVANPYGTNNGAGTDPIRQGVVAWSIGKDGKLGKNGDNKFTKSDDVISWQ